MPINSVSLSNTFGQWLIATQQLIVSANNLELSTYTKPSGTLVINSTGTGLSVLNHSTTGSLGVTRDATISGNCSISKTLTAANLTINSGSYNGSIYVTRGTSTRAELYWNESVDRWQARNVSTGSLSNVVIATDVSTTTYPGIVQLLDSYNTNDINKAATAAAIYRLNQKVDAIPGGAAVDIGSNAYNQANTAYLRANSAWFLANQANTKANTGGTFSGAVTVQGTLAYNSTLTGGTGTINIGNGQITKDASGNVWIGLGASGGGSSLFVRGIAGQNRGTSIGFGGYNLYSTLSDNSNFSKMVIGGTVIELLPTGGSGNVGIGVNDPAQKLVVNGNIDAECFGIPSIGGVGKTLVQSERYFITVGGQTVYLPAAPALGNELTITIVGSFVNTVVDRNGKLIMGLAENMTIDKPNTSVTLIYTSDSYGWRLF